MDPTARKVIINKNVIFVEDMLYIKEGDSTLKKNADTISFIEDKQSKQEQLKSFEVVSEHNEQVLDESETPEVWQSTRKRREPSWHSQFILAINAANYLLTDCEEFKNY